MKFEEILASLRAGKGVRRSSWIQTNRSLKKIETFQDGATLPQLAYVIDGVQIDPKNRDADLLLDVLADDWEVAQPILVEAYTFDTAQD